MSALLLSSAFPVFTDKNGNPLEDGYIYIGTQNLNPETNPITVYFDSAMTIPAAQPIRTIGGYPSRNGSPAQLYVSSSCSMVVRDKKRAFVFNSPVFTGNGASRSVVDTYASLIQITGLENQSMSMLGYYAAGDGGNNEFYYSSSSTATHNGITVIKPTAVSGAGRWLAVNTDTMGLKQYGAKADGVNDDSAAILAFDATGKKLSFINDEYLYTSKTNPTFTGGVELINASVNGSRYDGIITTDSDGFTLLGLDHNHQEDDNGNLGSNLAITSGVLVSPPVSNATTPDDLDVIAHWYQDFGLDYTRSGNGSNGSLTWYYWTWNHTDSGAYYEDRHPLVGWYRGDDAKVLDWQCYWLREAGIKAVSLLPSDSIDTSTWSTASNHYHWLYQLFTNCPNFNGLQYLLWGKYTGNLAQITAAWESMIDDIYLVYRNFYCVRMNGRLYPVIYIFEGSNHFINVGNTEAASISFFQAIANRFIAQGYAGVAVFSRHPKSDSSLSREKLEGVNCLYFAADYSAHGAWLDASGSATDPVVSDATTYQAMFESWSPYHERADWAVGVSYTAGQTVKRRGSHFLCTANHTSAADDTPGEGKNSFSYWIKRGAINREIVSVPTSKYAVSPHPSTGNAYWKATGQTPALFRKWFQRAVDSVMSNETPPIVMLYNVSEWAEGGPGLMPNKQDGFGYLDAVRSITSRTRDRDNVQPVRPTTQVKVNDITSQFLLAETTINPTSKTVRIDLDFDRTLTATPTISAGFDSQVIRLMNIDSTYSVTLQDNATLAGSNLFLTASTVTLGLYDSVNLEYVSGKGWVQISNVVNVL